MKTEDRAVVVAAYGGPKNIEEIPEFLQAIFGSPPAQPIIHRTIERYQKIGGRSPLCDDVERLVAQIRTATNVSVDHGFRFTTPFLTDVVSAKIDEGFKRIDILPLTPFYSAWSIDSMIDGLVPLVKRDDKNIDLYTIHGFSGQEQFLEAWAEIIEPLLPDIDIVFFTAHSLPLSDRTAADLYPAQVNTAAFTIAERLGIETWAVVFQSAGARGGEWLQPCIESEIEKLEPGTRLLVVPIGFVSENVETLYDLDVQARSIAEAVGVEFIRAETPLFNKKFIELIKSFIENPESWERCLL